MNVDTKLYKKLYFDIRNFTDQDAEKHFKNYGIFEGRIANSEMLNERIMSTMLIKKYVNRDIACIIINNLNQLYYLDMYE